MRDPHGMITKFQLGFFFSLSQKSNLVPPTTWTLLYSYTCFSKINSVPLVSNLCLQSTFFYNLQINPDQNQKITNTDYLIICAYFLGLPCSYTTAHHLWWLNLMLKHISWVVGAVYLPHVPKEGVATKKWWEAKARRLVRCVLYTLVRRALVAMATAWMTGAAVMVVTSVTKM